MTGDNFGRKQAYFQNANTFPEWKILNFRKILELFLYWVSEKKWTLNLKSHILTSIP